MRRERAGARAARGRPARIAIPRSLSLEAAAIDAEPVPGGGASSVLAPERRPLPLATGLLVIAAGAVAGLLAVAAAGPLASAGFLAAVVALGVALRRAGPVPALATLLAAMVFQNLVAAAFARELGSSGVMAALAGKELFALAVAATGLVLLRGRLPGTLADRACALYVLAVAALVAAAGLDGSVASAASLRQALTLPLLYVVGRSASPGAAGSSRLLGVVLRLGLVAASFGLLERFLLGDAFFVDLGLGVLFEKKGLGSWVFGELPGNFYSWDAGRPLRRLVGTIAEPTSMAHFLAVPVALLIGARSVLAGRGPAAGVGIVPALALLLTLGKSGIATASIGAATGLARQGRWIRVAAALALCLGVAGFAGALAVSPLLRANLENHTEGLVAVFERGLALTGSGFGTAGNFSVALRGDALPDSFVPRESFVAALTAQGGALGAGTYLLFCAAVALSLLVPRARGVPTDVRSVLAGLVVATALTSAASETPAGFLAGGFVFLLAGAAIGPPRARDPRGAARPGGAALQQELPGS